MVSSVHHSTHVSSFLATGQRFHADDIFTTGGSQELTVNRLVRDDLGLLHAVLRDDDGREISMFIEQAELAIEIGALTPVSVNLTGLAS